MLVVFSSGLLINRATKQDWVLRSCSCYWDTSEKDGARAARKGAALQRKVSGEPVLIQRLDHGGQLNI